jgi:glycosyltransferase involved in cell wall biosynthesis
MHIILAVTNDISTDQRVMRTAFTLQKIQAEVTIIGRRYGNQPMYSDPRFRAIRMRLLFKKGPLFYAEYNLQLFIRLMFLKSDLLVANDLDTLPAVFLVSRIRRISLVYDCHEYFTEVPELTGRRGVQKIWEWLESAMVPHLQYAYTVSSAIAAAYQKKYGITMKVIRNLPFRRDLITKPSDLQEKERDKIIIYQGSLNMGRGLEQVIRAIQYTHNIRLIIIGKGDVENKLKQLALSLGLMDRITFSGRISPERLFDYTVQADLGISLEEDLGLNYRFSLPNKVFDYIQAGVPVLVSNLPEVKALVEKYDVGMVNYAGNAEDLGGLFTEMTGNDEKRRVWKANLKIAAAELCWENEEGKLVDIYRQAMGNQELH